MQECQWTVDCEGAIFEFVALDTEGCCDFVTTPSDLSHPNGVTVSGSMHGSSTLRWAARRWWTSLPVCCVVAATLPPAWLAASAALDAWTRKVSSSWRRASISGGRYGGAAPQEAAAIFFCECSAARAAHAARAARRSRARLCVGPNPQRPHFLSAR